MTTNFYEEVTGEKLTTGEVLKSCRKNLGLSQRQVSAILEIQETVISKYENNKLNLGGLTAFKFASLYDVSVSSLLFPNGEGDIIKEKIEERLKSIAA